MEQQNTRRLVTVRRISDITPIKGSQYQIVTVDGWKVVVRGQRFQKGQLAVYVEIDSFLPCNHYFWEYSAYSSARLGDEHGFLVATTMICKHISQGLVFNLNTFEEISNMFTRSKTLWGINIAEKEVMAMSFQNLLGVKKWQHLDHSDSTKSFGRPPAFFPQPGCQRVQNLPSLFRARGEDSYQVTEKLDGVPMSVYAVNRSSRWYLELPSLPRDVQHIGVTRIGVCSRSQDLAETSTSWFWRTAKQQQITEKIDQAGQNIVVQGELCGSSILENTAGFAPGEHRFYVFDIFDIDSQRHLQPDQVTNICSKLGWDHVPVLYDNIKLSAFADSIQDLLVKAEGVGLKGRMREGLVFKTLDASFYFKAISNSWLLETGKNRSNSIRSYL
ncbi:RNA ligase-domain-containing protein [Hypoxylon sp. NC0597]|nr:RNA ligase-domain-containing protein [Hypoxylon sp. NC0597]